MWSILNGTIVNAGTVIVGTLLGVSVAAKLPERYRQIVLTCLGLVTIMLGVDAGVLKFANTVSEFEPQVESGGTYGARLAIVDQVHGWPRDEARKGRLVERQGGRDAVLVNAQVGDRDWHVVADLERQRMICPQVLGHEDTVLPSVDDHEQTTEPQQFEHSGAFGC